MKKTFLLALVLAGALGACHKNKPAPATPKATPEMKGSPDKTDPASTKPEQKPAEGSKDPCSM